MEHFFFLKLNGVGYKKILSFTYIENTLNIIITLYTNDIQTFDVIYFEMET